MKYRKNYIKLPLIVFSSIFLVRLYLIISAIISLRELAQRYSYKYPTAWSVIFTVQTKAILICTSITIVTLVIYFILRQRYINVLYSRIHIWLTFISLILIPFLSPVYQMSTPNGTLSDTIRIGNVIVYPFSSVLSLCVFIIAFIFFILTVIKSSTSPKEPGETVQSTGFLDEFADRQ